ncbi:hypothetical protein [Oceanospirillum maris]|uniref:hypothetical protein n=1 Tax=Oceanospirillum maris TaxID=64977 RepID=UPI000410E219|nr:hypothetical protein [Oceanospirillum maris]
MLDSFWIWPFISGASIAFLLGLAGATLFLRSAIWQGLVVGQSAAAGGVLASVMALPLVPVALLFSALVSLLTRRKAKLQQERLLLAFLLCGALMTLLIVNIPQASVAASRWLEGDVYFITRQDSLWLLIPIMMLAVGYSTLQRVWQHSQIMPDRGCAPRLSRWRFLFEAFWQLLLIVLGCLFLGLPAALFLILLPAWIAAFVANGFKPFLLLSSLISLVLFVISWAVALDLDQPFSPILILLGSSFALLIYLLKPFFMTKK